MRLKELRIAAGLKQVDLAEKMKVSQSTIAGWESGTCYPSAQKIPALAAALGVTVNELFREETVQDGGKETADGNEKADC